MASLLGFSVFGVDWQFLKPYIVLASRWAGSTPSRGVGLD